MYGRNSLYTEYTIHLFVTNNVQTSDHFARLESEVAHEAMIILSTE